MAKENVWNVRNHSWFACPLSSLRRATKRGPEMEVFLPLDICDSSGLGILLFFYLKKLDAEKRSVLPPFYAIPPKVLTYGAVNSFPFLGANHLLA